VVNNMLSSQAGVSAGAGAGAAMRGAFSLAGGAGSELPAQVASLAAPCVTATDSAKPRPRVRASAWAPGQQPVSPQFSPTKHTNMTRIVALGGDASGSQPAWDPV
jgi:hypothetical protein